MRPSEKNEKIDRMGKKEQKNVKMLRKSVPSNQFYKDFEHERRSYRQPKYEDSSRKQFYYNQNHKESKHQSRQQRDQPREIQEQGIDQQVLILLEYISLQQSDKKALRWWEKFDLKYFRPIKGRQTVWEMKKMMAERSREQRGKSQSNKKSDQSNNVTQGLEGSLIDNEVLSYVQEMFFEEFPFLSQKDLIRVLFLNPATKQKMIVGYELSSSIPSYSTVASEENGKVFIQAANQSQNSRQELVMASEKDPELRQWKLDLVDFVEDQSFIQKCEKYQTLRNQGKFVRELDYEIALWEEEVAVVAKGNSTAWKQLGNQVHEQNLQQIQDLKAKLIPESQEKLLNKIEGINCYLTWSTILRYFQQGLADKTQQMLNAYQQNMKSLKPVKGSGQNSLKWFETDCKICFCSANQDSNQVLYCDQCNTSYHRACYGLKGIPKQEEYFCDSCAVKKKLALQASRERSENLNVRVICQICQKHSFPIKCIEGHYYHITCLMIFNYSNPDDIIVEYAGGKFQFREGISHQKIQEDVIDNELDHQFCDYCVNHGNSDIGMQLKCIQPGCQVTLHPICAYLYGCDLQVKRKMQGKVGILDVALKCHQHCQEGRDHVKQIYLRRYLCNFKDSSTKNLQQFRSEFQEEEKRRQLCKGSQKDKGGPQGEETGRILNITKQVKRYVAGKNQNLKKGSNDVETETGRLLESFKRKKHYER